VLEFSEDGSITSSKVADFVQKTPSLISVQAVSADSTQVIGITDSVLETVYFGSMITVGSPPTEAEELKALVSSLASV